MMSIFHQMLQIIEVSEFLIYLWKKRKERINKITEEVCPKIFVKTFLILIPLFLSQDLK